MPRPNPWHDLPRTVCCHLCGMPLHLTDSQLDHVIPRCRGGRAGVGNQRWAHQRYNRLKGTLLLSELQELCDRIARNLSEVEKIGFSSPHGPKEGAGTGQRLLLSSLHQVLLVQHARLGHFGLVNTRG